MRKFDFENKVHKEYHRKGEQAAEIDLDALSESYIDRNLTDIRRRVSDLQSALKGDERLLDFGTGMGHFLEMIEPYVDRAIGSEINRKRVAFVRENLGFDVHEGTGSLLSTFGPDSFNVVTMYHTLEHLPNPVEQLKKVRSLLKQDGLLVVEVPNHDDWLLSASKAYADFYYQEAHAYYFTPDTLMDLLMRAGFKTRIEGTQRYSYQNAIQWMTRGKPEIRSPSRCRSTWINPIDKIYKEVLKERGICDTLIVYCEKV